MAESEGRVVWINRRDGERCLKCRAAIPEGQFIALHREDGARCMACEGLADLVFLPSGDPALTRRAASFSARSAVVVEFVRRRKRNERRGTLVETSAIERARESCAADAERRAAKAVKRRVKDEVAEREYLERFRAGILEMYPCCPEPAASEIAQHACAKYSGRVGRSASAKALDPETIKLAVRAHIRHVHTEYDSLLGEGLTPKEARPLIRARVDEVALEWSGRETRGAGGAKKAFREGPGER
jgi:hypothetical protein